MNAQPDHLAAAREKAKGAKRKDISEKFAEKPTRKTAIDAMCQQCMGGPENDGWTRLIRKCTAGPDSVNPCPLWQFRPYQ